ncbi:MAG: nucleoside triphosphate pyrophosphatase [Intestinibacillus sp.]
MKEKLILASASPRRQELLRLLTADFEVRPADVDETLDPAAPLQDEIVRLAVKKARAAQAAAGESCFVIGSDTIVSLSGAALGKPQDAADAKRMLRLLSGRTHEVITALALVTPDGREDTALNVTRVTFYELDERMIERYVATGEPLDKAGAYGIQGRGAALVRGIEGDYYSVMGLPVAQLARLLRAHGLWEG